MTVHSILPQALAIVAERELAAAGVRHVRHGLDRPADAALVAASDPDATALIGPFRSRDVAEAIEVTAPARLPLIAPLATWAGVTRDDEPGCDDAVRHDGTVFRLVARDTEVTRRLAVGLRRSGHRALLVAGAHDYGLQLAAQLQLAGLPVTDHVEEADLVVLAGLADEPEIAAAAATAPRPLIAFDGVQGADLGERDLRLALPFEPVDGVSTEDLFAGIYHAREAAQLVAEAERQGRDRAGALAWLRASGAFDAHGDPVRAPVWLWRAQPSGVLQPDAPL